MPQGPGSEKRAREDHDSSASFQHDGAALSDYGGGNKWAGGADLKDGHIDDANDGGDKDREDGGKGKKKATAAKEHHEDNDFNLSDLEEEQKKELLDLEMQIERDNLTRGERRRLQNKRNVLKAKIKKELETEGHKSKISKLQKRVLHLKKQVQQGTHYRDQRDALREENRLLKKELKELGGRVEQLKGQR